MSSAAVTGKHSSKWTTNKFVPGTKCPVDYPYHMQVEWPELDPLKLRAEQDGEEIILMTYRYPVPADRPRKGVAFYVHGFGAYCEHSAFLFKQIAEAGYEVFALDQRGFGNSGGQRGLLESQNTIYSDLYLFIYTAIRHFAIDQQTTPLFLIGKSFGGLTSFNLSLRFPTLFKGMALVVPFFKHASDTIDKYQYVFKFAHLFQLYYSFGMRTYPDKYSFLTKDPKTVHEAKISSLVMFHDEQQFARKYAPTQTTPFIVVNASLDDVVRNATSKDILGLVRNSQNKIIEVKGADHMTITVDEQYVEQLVSAVVTYFDSLLE